MALGSALNKDFQVLDQYWCRHTSPHEVSGAQCFSLRQILALFELVFVFSVGGPTPSEAAGGRAHTDQEITKRDGLWRRAAASETPGCLFSFFLEFSGEMPALFL